MSPNSRWIDAGLALALFLALAAVAHMLGG